MIVKSIKAVHDHVVDNYNHPNISALVKYLVIEIDHESYRIINDNDEPILYPKELFTIVDDTIPEDWVHEKFDDGEYFLHPPEFKDYFFEDYFDGDKNVKAIFKKYIAKIR